MKIAIKRIEDIFKYLFSLYLILGFLNKTINTEFCDAEKIKFP